MIQRIKRVVRLQNQHYQGFLYRAVNFFDPADIRPGRDRFTPTVISYDLYVPQIEMAATGTDVYVPGDTGFRKLRINFRGGNSHQLKIGSSVKLIWYFERPQNQREFETDLGAFLRSLSIDLPFGTSVPGPASVPKIVSAEGADLDAFRLNNLWLFGGLMPCDAAQMAFVDNRMSIRENGAIPITNVYLEAVSHIKNCDRDSCVSFAFENEVLDRSIREIREFDI